ncbi:hypothetical protein, partial [Flavobacterium sinopsychrotolerans]|uniref:hypothetical protein n=1 Tax=Flavobacterium sinopsychrotolerans TaxID=604089 RepID=UPI003B439071
MYRELFNPLQSCNLEHRRETASRSDFSTPFSIDVNENFKPNIHKTNKRSSKYSSHRPYSFIPKNYGKDLSVGRGEQPPS